MLVAFEGQDGAGKTALLTAVQEALIVCGVPTTVVGEFSDSPHGQRLAKAVEQDKFLRPVPGEMTTVLTRALEIVADLYYFDECVIAPALQHSVVLKDRHVDTILYTLAPTLTRSGAVGNEQQALTWLRGLCSELRHKPDLTVYVDAPLAVRRQRIERRRRHLAEARGNEISGEDKQVFAARARILRRLLANEPDRFLVVDNGERPLQEGASQVVEAIRARLAAAPQRSTRQHG